MESTIIRESTVKRGPHIICVLEFNTGEILMRVDDTRCGIQEDIALQEYLHLMKRLKPLKKFLCRLCAVRKLSSPNFGFRSKPF